MGIKQAPEATLVTGNAGLLTSYVSSYVKRVFLDTLRDGIRVGQLRFTESDGTHHIFGETAPDIDRKPTIRNQSPQLAAITVMDDIFYSRVATTHDLGFAEAYMLGDFITPDISSVLSLWLDNQETLLGLQTLSARFFSATSSTFARVFGQNTHNARLNCIAGYDTSNTLFRAFLGETMLYSSALWDGSLGGVRGDLQQAGGPSPDEERLDKAASNKLQYMLRQARMQPGDRVLEFGSGWGQMAIEACRLGCASVETLTLSSEQKAMAEARIAAAGFADRARVHLLDYRDFPQRFPELAHSFDAFVASEMLEHVGERHHAEFFRIIDWALKPRGAGFCITATCRPEHRYTLYQSEDYARRYQWPNTFLPSVTSVATAVQRAVPGKFVLYGIRSMAGDYARTLREWSYLFKQNWTPELKAKLIEEQPQLQDERDMLAFQRRWEYMFAYAEVGFAKAYAASSCWTFLRPEYPEAV